MTGIQSGPPSQGCWEQRARPQSSPLCVWHTALLQGCLLLLLLVSVRCFYLIILMLFIVPWPSDSRNYYPISQKGK